MSTTTEDLKKLTIPLLKALCKDRKITGYSKLGKNAIIQKLIEHSSGTVTTTTTISNTTGSLGSTQSSTSAVVASPTIVASTQIVTASREVALASLPPGQTTASELEVCINNQTLPKKNTEPCGPKEALPKSTNTRDDGGYILSSKSSQQQ
jgi:hypothetical protein